MLKRKNKFKKNNKEGSEQIKERNKERKGKIRKRQRI